MDGTTSTTSPKPRKWKPVSQRWKQQLEKLANIDDCELTSVGTVVFRADDEFLIGTGSKGTEVFLGLADDGTEVAVKRMMIRNIAAMENEKACLSLKKLDHPSIVKYVDFAKDKNFGYLALQLSEYTLKECIREHKPSEEQRKQLAEQVLQSLKVLHCQDSRILHRDIKPENVFIDTQGKVRLADFGISRQLEEGETTKFTNPAGTPCWMAKETLEPGPVRYKRSTDIQVAGMLIYYILSGGHHPFGRGLRCQGNIYDGKYNLDHVQDEAKCLIKQMIHAKPERRPTVEECLEHHFWSNERKDIPGGNVPVLSDKELKRSDLSLDLLKLTSSDDDSDDGETPGRGAAKRWRWRTGLKIQEDLKYITFYQNKFKTNVEDPFTCLPTGSVQRTDMKDFEDFYTHVSIIHVDDTEISCAHEVRQMERNRRWQDIQQSENVMKKAGQEIQLSDIFKHPSGKNKRIRTVMSIGNAGVGKTFLVNKFVSDWAKKKHQDPHLTFVFQFRYLNLLRGRRFTLAQLIHEVIGATKCIPEDYLNDIFTELQNSGNANYDKSLIKLLFIFDGLDESILPLHFKIKPNHDFSIPIPLEELLVNLLEGKLLRCVHIWITTRPAAAKRIPSEYVNMLMEVKGFTDARKEEYFRKRFSDERLANRIISHMQKSKSLHDMCEIPVFCSMVATILRDMLRRDETGQLPKTMTEMNCRYLVVQTMRKKKKYDESHDVNQQQSTKKDREVILKLGRLAFEHLEKGNIIFNQEHLEQSGLDVKEASLYSGMFTEIFKGERLDFQKYVYSFVHLSIQEFLAAVYLFHCFTQKNMGVLKTFLGEDEMDWTLDAFLHRVMKNALWSENGHLDLFVRFLHGLSLESNQSLLGGLLGQTENSPKSIQRAINNLKKMTTEHYFPERMINIFHCLMEMNDHSVFQEVQQYLQSADTSKTELSESQCSALAFMLLMSEEVVDELNLDTYNTSKRGRQRLVPAVRNSRKARLVDCDLQKEHLKVVPSALSSNPSHLRELDLSKNWITPSSLDLICSGLKSPNCILEALRLADCWMSDRCCDVLALALRSNPSHHLRELDLSLNMVNDSGLKELISAGVNVKHGGEDWLNSQFITKHFQSLTLDTNTAHRYLSLSKNNREVTWMTMEDQHHPDHPDRFDCMEQVLCTERLTGLCYCEVECRGECFFSIAVTDRGISRKGRDNDCKLGYSDQSWSLVCGHKGYTVRHNREKIDVPVRPCRLSKVASTYRVAVYLDCDSGTLSFYEVTSDSLTHLYTFHNTFTDLELVAGFGVKCHYFFDMLFGLSLHMHPRMRLCEQGESRCEGDAAFETALAGMFW